MVSQVYLSFGVEMNGSMISRPVTRLVFLFCPFPAPLGTDIGLLFSLDFDSAHLNLWRNERHHFRQ